MNSNKILPFVGLLVIFMVIFVGIKSCSKTNEAQTTLAAVPKTGIPDVDSPADTIRSLTAKVDAVKDQGKLLNQQNEILLRQRNEMEAKISADLRKELRDKPPASGVDKAISEMTQQLDYFNARIEEMGQGDEVSIGTHSQSDIPIGFGLDDSRAISDSMAPVVEDIIWIEPLGLERDKKGNPINTNAVSSLLHPSQSNSLDVDSYLEKAKLPALEETEEPVYTVPRNSTLIGSISMTALIGRIPLNGIVQEPFPFKVIVGKDNLATNGIELPFLDGMIFSGMATGDWTLSCVRGSLHSVTYVFTDGTIRTLSSDDGSLQEKSQRKGQSSSQGNRSLGWISDRRGIPCVAGERISNATDYLTGRIFAAGASAAAQAFAQGEVTNSVSPIGGVSTSVITGDSATYAGYNALSGGINEVSEYLEERGAQSFDVIYVDTGVELAVHVDAELPIDYEINGRKTRYAQTTNNNNPQYLD